MINPILEAYARAEVLRLSVKWDVKPPGIGWFDMTEPAMRIIDIMLSKRWDTVFFKDVRTLPMLSYAIAHEFRHWLTVAKWFPIPLPRGPRWQEKRKQWHEKAAHEFAEAETGISKPQFWDWWYTYYPK